MRKMRLLFKKTGRAAFISHLDTMRTLQRAIARADVAAKHTEGFNPHAYISIALPLSLGYTSDCEMMNFVAEDAMTGDTITARLNAVLPEGLIAVRTYETERKVKEICAARFVITLDYDDGVPEGCGGALKQFYTNSPVYVMKKSKRGEKQ
ncbi:MAG: TIGR03936 family radical SAM-associated protein, partial [Clostridia bacterium]